MAFCLTIEAKNNFKRALKERKITPDILIDLKTSEARRNLFAKYVGKENAVQVNALFEKAILKPNTIEAMIDAARQVSGLKPEGKRGLIRKIEAIDKLMTNSEMEQFMEDAVSEGLGVKLTKQDYEKAKQYSEKLQAEAKQESKFGTPTLEYFKVKKEFTDYLNSLKPTSRLRVATQTIGRGMMLASFKSPLLNIESNTVFAFLTAWERRIANRAFTGVNGEYGTEYRKFVKDVYLKTGYDITRMLSVDSQQLVRGEDIGTTQGKGTIRAVGRVVEDVVFKKLQGYPDVAFASFAFSDRANMESTKIARREGAKGKDVDKRALEIFKDATRINPRTEEGLEVRNNAIADATYSTYTNKTRYSDFSLAIRGALNTVTGDLRLGDQIMPFVKTPANVIGAGIDSSGVLIPFDVIFKIGKSYKAIKNGDNIKTAVGESFSGFARKVILAGLGMSYAYLLSTLFDDDDFIGEYPVSEKERKLLELKQARERSVRIAGRWVSLDYFGPLASPLVGFLYAKKYGTDLPSIAWNYYSGVFAQAKSLPGLDEFKDIIDSLKEIGTSRGTLTEKQEDLVNFTIDFIRARSIPAIVSDTARAFDEYERRTDRGLFDRVFSGVPGLRQTLPEKKNVFGESIRTAGTLSTYLFGARVKVQNNNSVIKELDRLSDVGFLPSITDVEKTSSRAKKLLIQIGEKKFDRAKTEFGRRLYAGFKKLMEKSSYKKMDDEEKQYELDKIKRYEFERMLKRAGYKK